MPATIQGGTYTIGGKTYKVTPAEPVTDLDGNTTAEGYPKVEELQNGKWVEASLIGGSNKSLHAAAALQDPRFAQWLSQDDPSTQADNLVRGVWARDPAEAFRLYGSQAARKPGGVDPTPDASYFTDDKYWPAQFGIGLTGVDKDLTNDTAYVAHQLGLDTAQNGQASAQMAQEMSPSAQHDRNDPDAWYEGPVAQFALLAAAAYFGMPYLAGEGAAGAAGAAGGLEAVDAAAAAAFNAGNTLGAGGAAAGLGGEAALGAGALGYGPGATVYAPGVAPAADGMAAFNAGNTLGAGGAAAGLGGVGMDTAGMDSLMNSLSNAPESAFNTASDPFIDPTTGLQYSGNGLGQGTLTAEQQIALQQAAQNPTFMQQLTQSPIGTAAKALGLTNSDGSLNIGSMIKAGLLTAGALGAGGAISNLTGGTGVGGVSNDFVGAAKETAAGNWQNLLGSSKLNHPNLNGPQGSVTWEYDPVTGQWTSKTALSAGEQNLYDQSVQSGLLRGDLVNQALYNNANTLTKGIDLSALPSAPINPGTTAYDAIMSRLEPQLTREQQSLDTALANSGFDPGSAGWAAKQQLFGQNRNDLRLNAAKEAIGLDTTARQNALNEQVTMQQTPLKNIATLMSLPSTSYTQPNFGTTWTPASTTPGADILGATQMASAQQTANNSLATATKNANLNGLVGIGSSLLSSDGFWNWLK